MHEAEERPDDGARVVHRAVKAEGQAALGRVRGVRDHRVARRAADPLADPVRQAYGEHLMPVGGEPEQRPRSSRQRVAEDDQPLAPPAPVGEVAGEEFEQAGDGFGRALYEADGDGRGAERDRRERSEQEADR